MAAICTVPGLSPLCSASDLGDTVDGSGIDDIPFLRTAREADRHQLLAAVGPARQQLQLQVVPRRVGNGLARIVQHPHLEPLHVWPALPGDVQRRRNDEEIGQRRQAGAHARTDLDRQIGDDGLTGVGVFGGGAKDDRAGDAAGVEVRSDRARRILERLVSEGQGGGRYRRAGIRSHRQAFLVFRVTVQIKQSPAAQAGDDIYFYQWRRENPIIFLGLHGQGVGERPSDVGTQIGEIGLQSGFIGKEAHFHGIGAAEAATATATATTRHRQPEQQQRAQSEYSASHRKHGEFSPHQ